MKKHCRNSWPPELFVQVSLREKNEGDIMTMNGLREFLMDLLERKSKMKIPNIKTLGLLVLSCILCSVAVNWIAIPNEFVVTGMTGFSMTIAEFTGINYAVVNYGLTLLILIVTYVALGKQDVANIICLSILYPTILWVMNYINVEIVFEEKLVAIGAYGILYGAGAGIPYRMGFSYGGSDTIAKVLKKKVFPAVEFKQILLAIEVFIRIVMLFAFSLDIVAYTFVAQLIYVWCMNYIVFQIGPDLYEIQIIGINLDGIEEFVIEKIKKSVTISKVTGGYSGEEKIQMDCVCSSKDYVRLRKFLRESGYDCFIKVFPLLHVFGRNKEFHSLYDENLE